MDKTVFYNKIKRLARKYGEEKAAELCSNEFGVSRPTFKRWVSNRNHPHPFMAEVAIKQINKWLNDKNN